MRSRPEWLAPALVATVAVVGAALLLPRSPRIGYDSLGYLKFADTLQGFGVIPADRPDRLPGYPLFILLARAVAAALHTHPLATLAVIQVLLLAGLTPLLVYGIGRRASGRRSVGLIAAVLVATDVDLQLNAGAVMTEAPATTLLVLALWLRLRDHAWWRSAWALAAAVLTKPYLAPVVLVLGVLDAFRLRRPSACVASTWPTALVVAGWLGLVVLAGGQPMEHARRIKALNDFVTAYDAGLVRGTVDPIFVPLFENAARGRMNAFEVAKELTGSRRPANEGTDWRMLRTIADSVIRKRRSEYVAARLAIVPYAWSGWHRYRPAVPGPLGTWQRAYSTLFYGSLPVLGVLLVLALWNGLGWPTAIPTMRGFVVPIIVVVLAIVASMSAGTWEVGREVIVIRPMSGLLWACVLGRVPAVIAEARSRASGGSPRAPWRDRDDLARR